MEEKTELMRSGSAGLVKGVKFLAEDLKMAKKIKVNIFDDMRAALRDAAAYERGEAVDLRVTRLPAS